MCLLMLLSSASLSGSAGTDFNRHIVDNSWYPVTS